MHSSTKQSGHQLENVRTLRGRPVMVAMQHTLLRLLWSGRFANIGTARAVDDSTASVGDHDICFEGWFRITLAARGVRILQLDHGVLVLRGRLCPVLPEC